MSLLSVSCHSRYNVFCDRTVSKSFVLALSVSCRSVSCPVGELSFALALSVSCRSISCPVVELSFGKLSPHLFVS
jgi:hypothetical protein